VEDEEAAELVDWLADLAADRAADRAADFAADRAADRAADHAAISRPPSLEAQEQPQREREKEEQNEELVALQLEDSHSDDSCDSTRDMFSSPPSSQHINVALPTPQAWSKYL
jgi:hypothetical protein